MPGHGLHEAIGREDEHERQHRESQRRRRDRVEVTPDGGEARGELAGFSVMRRPRKSRICVLAISTAMPLVNPTTTGRGMKRTALPLRVAPSTTRMTPAIIVQRYRPDTPTSTNCSRRRMRVGLARTRKNVL